MNQEISIRSFTLLLAIIAGFCDILTFICTGQFSAHVTGNFLLFAYDIVKGADQRSWVKLLTFPIFVAAVMTGGWVISRSTGKYTIIRLEGLVMIATGVIVPLIDWAGVSSQWVNYLIPMPVVFAMGLQNAFGRLYSKETFGPTTIMTGNVTQLALDLLHVIKNPTNDVAKKALRNLLVPLAGFFIGCLTGAIAGKTIGMAAVIIPGIAMVLYTRLAVKQTSVNEADNK